MVTSQEVARAAGVSRATVSYVLNGADHQRISGETRARVLAVAEQLGYRPNAAALALRNGHSDIVLLALPDWPHGPVIVDAIDAAVGELRSLGYTPLVHFEQPDDTATLAETCRRIQPLGVIAPGERASSAFVRKLRTNRTKGVVAIDVQPHRHVSTVVVRQAALGRAALEYLASSGHRRVLALMPPGSDLAAGRVSGAREVDGVRLDLVESTLDPADVAAALARLGRNTAVYAFNDDYAFVAMRALLERGMAIPGDVAVIGTDDVATAQLFRPALTTVRIDGRGFGLTLARALHASITEGVRERTAAAVDFLAPEVIRRESA